MALAVFTTMSLHPECVSVLFKSGRMYACNPVTFDTHSHSSAGAESNVRSEALQASYILPIATDNGEELPELTAYLCELANMLDVIVVDGSPEQVFRNHHSEWARICSHVSVDRDLVTGNGKVGGILTGIRLAQHERIIVADDDVRYGPVELAQVLSYLDHADVARPQNYFQPAPWHALWDMSRSLLNRMTGGDWPGTFGVRASALCATHGYRGDVMFENYEMVRTITVAGGREIAPLNVFVRRRPPAANQFFKQRTRQAYDEFARPSRALLQLALLPILLGTAIQKRWRLLVVAGLAVVVLAEAGRRRGGGASVFPGAASVLAPVWLLERSICIWFAFAEHVRHQGIAYRGLYLPAGSRTRHLRGRYTGRLDWYRNTPASSAASPDANQNNLNGNHTC